LHPAIIYQEVFYFINNLVVYHHGKLLTGGHYTCHVLLQGQEWMLIDDTILTPSTPKEVIAEKDDRQVYMLFYTKK
jgi:ubiquitin C-terminal hydrolase